MSELTWDDSPAAAYDLVEHKFVDRPGKCVGIMLYVRRRADGKGTRIQFEVDEGTANTMRKELGEAVPSTRFSYDEKATRVSEG